MSQPRTTFFRDGKGLRPPVNVLTDKASLVKALGDALTYCDGT